MCKLKLTLDSLFKSNAVLVTWIFLPYRQRIKGNQVQCISSWWPTDAIVNGQTIPCVHFQACSTWMSGWRQSWGRRGGCHQRWEPLGFTWKWYHNQRNAHLLNPVDGFGFYWARSWKLCSSTIVSCNLCVARKHRWSQAHLHYEHCYQCT